MPASMTSFPTNTATYKALTCGGSFWYSLCIAAGIFPVLSPAETGRSEGKRHD